MRNKTSLLRNKKLCLAAFTLVLLSSVSYGNSSKFLQTQDTNKQNTDKQISSKIEANLPSKANNKFKKTFVSLPWLVEKQKLIVKSGVQASAASIPNIAGVVAYSYYYDRKTNLASASQENKTETVLPWLVGKITKVEKAKVALHNNQAIANSENKTSNLIENIALATRVSSGDIYHDNYDTIITKLEPAAIEVEKLNDGVVDATVKAGESLPTNIDLPKPEADNKVKEIINELRAEEKVNKDNHIDLPQVSVAPLDKKDSTNIDLPKSASVAKENPNKVDFDHLHKNSLDTGSDVKGHEGVGIKLTVKTPRVNVDQLLENAYDATIAGNQEEAILLYRRVLSVQPNSKLGLFGLATVYHRAGQTQLALPLYKKLLDLYPNNVEGLNNYLVLLSDEKPKDALIELEKLERSHSGFSPIPAQMAIIYERMGDYYKAARKMSQAIELSPENLKYRYNMAIILDQQGDWEDAATFYRQLIVAEERGEKIPANSEEIQARLTFILSNKPDGQ